MHTYKRMFLNVLAMEDKSIGKIGLDPKVTFSNCSIVSSTIFALIVWVISLVLLNFLWTMFLNSIALDSILDISTVWQSNTDTDFHLLFPRHFLEANPICNNVCTVDFNINHKLDTLLLTFYCTVEYNYSEHFIISISLWWNIINYQKGKNFVTWLLSAQ